MKYLILSLVSFFSFIQLNAEEYLLDWYLKGTVYESIVLQDKSSYNLIKGEGPWEDNKGYFGHLNCIGKTSDINKNSILDMVCNAFDDDGHKFWLKLYRNSESDAGIGKVTYLGGTGKFKDFINLKCLYAVNYLKDNSLEERTGFYKQKCINK